MSMNWCEICVSTVVQFTDNSMPTASDSQLCRDLYLVIACCLSICMAFSLIFNFHYYPIWTSFRCMGIYAILDLFQHSVWKSSSLSSLSSYSFMYLHFCKEHLVFLCNSANYLEKKPVPIYHTIPYHINIYEVNINIKYKHTIPYVYL